MTNEIVLNLPICPPINKTRRIDWRHRATHKAWQLECDALLIAARTMPRRSVLRRRPITGKFAIDILLDRSCRYDLDAVVKSTVDYCVRIELVPDDSQRYLDDVHLHWGDVPEGMRVTLRSIT